MPVNFDGHLGGWRASSDVSPAMELHYGRPPAAPPGSPAALAVPAGSELNLIGGAAS
jgi:hypothetical protein